MDTCPSVSIGRCSCAADDLLFEPGCFANYPSLRLFCVGAMAFRRPMRLGRHVFIEMCSAMHNRRASVWEARTQPRTLYLAVSYEVAGTRHGFAFPSGPSLMASLRAVQRQVRRWIAGNRERERRRLAVAMALHGRLGVASALGALGEDLVAMCV